MRLKLPTALPCPATGSAEPGPPSGPCSIPIPREVLMPRTDCPAPGCPALGPGCPAPGWGSEGHDCKTLPCLVIYRQPLKPPEPGPLLPVVLCPSPRLHIISLGISCGLKRPFYMFWGALVKAEDEYSLLPTLALLILNVSFTYPVASE